MTAAVAAPIAAEAGALSVEKMFQALNTEIIGYHHTDHKYDAKGRPKESVIWNASLRGWELAGLLLVVAAWEVGAEISHAFKGGSGLADLLTAFGPAGDFAAWGITAMNEAQAGQSMSAPPAGTFMQTLSAQLTLTLNTFASLVQPALIPAVNAAGKGAGKMVAKAQNRITPPGNAPPGKLWNPVTQQWVG